LQLTNISTNDFLKIDIDDIKARDANGNGEFPRMLTNPLYKDTVAVQGRGGYTIIRFKADNPGKLLF
jgi:FtsP/CotA-like multicopper oxidase with cupredoxin domain